MSHVADTKTIWLTLTNVALGLAVVVLCIQALRALVKDLFAKLRERGHRS